MLKGIVAMSVNGVIGVGGKIPWNISEDMKHFKETTTGHTIVMGRNTWESLGCKPLPNRTNVVVSSSALPGEHDGGVFAKTLTDALAVCDPNTEDVFIIGGAKLYQSAWPMVEEWVVTEVPYVISVENAVRFPYAFKAEYDVMYSKIIPAKNIDKLKIVVYRRKHL